MRTTNTLLIATICFVNFSCSSSKPGETTNSLAGDAFKIYGRSATSHGELELISSAAHFGFSFTGTQCKVYASFPYKEGHNYFQYELDGVYQKRLRIENGRTEPLVIETPSTGRHTVWIYKATEATTGPVLIQKIEAEGIKAIEKPAMPLIEFIGNSITCGAAADASEVPCGQGEYHDQHNAYYAYGPRVARALGTEFILNSVSGIGIYRTWNMDHPSMPQVYETLDFQEQGTRKWDFNLFKPQVISIALGTNDFSDGDGVHPRAAFDSARFVKDYIQFVQLVHTKNPQALIALLSSPMVKGAKARLFENCLTAVKRNIDGQYPSAKPVAVFFFPPMEARGCSGHPSVEDHAIMAEELLPFFEKLLK
jgi:hypothetical protein